MKRIAMISILALCTPALVYAIPPCWKGSYETVGGASLNESQLFDWFALSGNPDPGPLNNDPDYYYAFHAAHTYCDINHGVSSTAVFTGPPELIDNILGNYDTSLGVQFVCRVCRQDMFTEHAPVEFTVDTSGLAGGGSEKK